MSDNTDWLAKPEVCADTVRMNFLERRAVANAHVLRLLGIGPWGATLRAAIDQAMSGEFLGSTSAAPDIKGEPADFGKGKIAAKSAPPICAGQTGSVGQPG